MAKTFRPWTTHYKPAPNKDTLTELMVGCAQAMYDNVDFLGHPEGAFADALQGVADIAEIKGPYAWLSIIAGERHE